MQQHLQIHRHVQVQDDKLEEHIFFVPMYSYKLPENILDKSVVTSVMAVLCVSDYEEGYKLVSLDNYTREHIIHEFDENIINLDYLLNQPNLYIKLCKETTYKFIEDNKDIVRMTDHIRENNMYKCQQYITSLKMQEYRDKLKLVLKLVDEKEPDLT